MLQELKRQERQIADICRRFGVARLSVFGSALGNEFDPAGSDVDFVVEFNATGREKAFDNYFGLRESLSALLGRRVDLTTRASIRNPLFKAEIDRTAEPIYAEAA
jgi:hypothetical protein